MPEEVMQHFSVFSLFVSFSEVEDWELLAYPTIWRWLNKFLCQLKECYVHTESKCCVIFVPRRKNFYDIKCERISLEHIFSDFNSDNNKLFLKRCYNRIIQT
jgi:hypothetical protein